MHSTTQLYVRSLPAFLLAASAASAMSVTLTPSAPPPQPVGTVVQWTATVPDANPGTLWYRFRAAGAGDTLRTIVDYGPNSALSWTASEWEGFYEIEVSVRNINTNDTAEATALYQMSSRVTASDPAISPTQNSLVFLYSAGACPNGERMLVEFVSADGWMQQTPYRQCRAGFSMNFYIGGLRANTQYTVRHFIDRGSRFVTGPVLTLATPSVDLGLAGYNVVVPDPPPQAQGILLQSTLAETCIATDLAGNLVWYYPGGITTLTRPAQGGYFLGVFEDPTTDPSHQFVRKFDLPGNTLAETNAARVNEQLTAMGMHTITAFHHEARAMPDGGILVDRFHNSVAIQRIVV